MYLGHGLPVLDPGKEDSGADDVPEPGPELLEGRPGDLEAPPGLRPGVAHTDRLPVGSEGSGPGHGHDVADPHGPRNPDDRLIRAAGCDAPPLAHGSMSPR